jgi:hypothetical protein
VPKSRSKTDQADNSYVKQTIADLLQNKIDMSQLVITKALAKADYAAKQAHVELAERMRKRDAGSAPALGDRVAYVIIKGIKGAAAYEKSEDPLYVLEHNVPIDTRYYLDNQLSKPLMRIFEPILGEKAGSLRECVDEKANDSRWRAYTDNPDCYAHYWRIDEVCRQDSHLPGLQDAAAICKGYVSPDPADADGIAVCVNCRSKLPELYQKHVNQTSSLQIDFARLWTQCQRCQGSLHQASTQSSIADSRMSFALRQIARYIIDGQRVKRKSLLPSRNWTASTKRPIGSDACYIMTCSPNPLRPNLSHPVLPESLTATIKALSPLRSSAMGFGRNGRSPNCLYCGPFLCTGPLGSSGKSSQISVSWCMVGMGTVRELRQLCLCETYLMAAA